jgi:hypothetical protein
MKQAITNISTLNELITITKICKTRYYDSIWAKITFSRNMLCLYIDNYDKIIGWDKQINCHEKLQIDAKDFIANQDFNCKKIKKHKLNFINL